MTTYKQTERAMGCSHRGFSMIDVLIAIVVLATGLLALGVLQGALTRNSTDARARSQIAAYTQSLIDETRAAGYDAFGSVTSVTASSSACSASPQSFSQKLQCDAYNAQTYAGASNVTTTISSTEYYGATGGTWVTPKPSGATDKTPHYKQVNVSTTWNDAQGQSRTLAYDTTVSPVSVTPTDNSLATNGFNLSTSTTPQVREANPGNTLGVIPIAISGTSNAAATNPKPVVTNTGTTFSQYTYNSTASSYGGNLITARVDTKVIQCKCKYISAGGVVTNDPNLGTILLQPYRPTYWDGYHYLTPTPTTATSSTTGIDSSATQDPDCDLCCRDRNDSSSDTIKFDHFTTSSGNPDYNHYKYALSGGSYTLQASTDSYQEACRLIRKDGAYATAPDTHNYFFGLLSTDTCSAQGTAAAPTGCTSTLGFSDTVPSTTTESTYASFVKDYLKTNFDSFKTTGKSGEASATPQTTGSTAAGKWNGSFSLNTPTNTTITLPNTISRWLYARGLYVDYLESQAQSVLLNAIANCSDSDVNNCALPVMPFTTINMSELGDTSSSAPTVIVVSNTAVIGGDETSPKRGNVTVPSGQTGASNPTANGVYTVYTTNSSLTAVEPTTTTSQANSPYDASNTILDQRQFTVSGASGGGGGGSGTVYFDVNFSGLSYFSNASSVSNYNSNVAVNWSGTSAQLGGTAASGSTTGYLSNGTYPVLFAGGSKTTPVSVSYASAVSPPLTITINVQGYNTSSLISNTYAGSGADTVTCSDGTSYTTTGSDKVMQCYNYAVDASNISVTTNGVTTNPGATAASPTNDGLMAEATAVSVPGIAGSTSTLALATNVVIPFTLTGTTIAHGTCKAKVTGHSTTYTYTTATGCP